MRKAVILFACLLLIPAAALAAEGMGQYTNLIDKLPDSVKSSLGTETIRLDVLMNDGTTQTFGIRTANGTITEYQKGAYPDSTMSLTISQSTVENVTSSKDPVGTLKEEWGSGIKLEGLTFWAKVKIFFLNVGIALFKMFSG